MREALDAARRKRACVIPGWAVWLAMAIVALIPMALLRLLLPGRDRRGAE